MKKKSALMWDMYQWPCSLVVWMLSYKWEVAGSILLVTQAISACPCNPIIIIIMGYVVGLGNVLVFQRVCC